MAVEVATLQFKADTTDLSKAEMRLKRLGRAANSAEHKLDDMNDEMKKGSSTAKGMGKAVLGLASALGTMAVAGKIIAVAREFDVVNASLKTVTGSTEGAQRAFNQIQEFASTTPYDLQQVSNAFVKLMAFGLDPSEEALTSYGNTASAMGKDLNQMIEAVADAATGEFERLRDFGIRARQENDQVSLTFRGTTTTIKKSSEEIQKYLLAIGNTEFGGAMDERAKTLDGAISNLADSIDVLFLTIAKGDQGIMNDFVRMTTEGIEGITDAIALANGTAGIDLQLEQVSEQLSMAEAALASFKQKQAEDAESELTLFERIFGRPERNTAYLEAQIAELTAKKQELENKAEEEAEATRKQNEENRLARETAAAEERARIEAEANAEKREDAQTLLDDLMSMNDTQLEALERREREQLELLKLFMEEGIISAQEYQDALTEIMLNGHAERKEIRLQELEDLHAENEMLMQGIIDTDEARKEQARQTTDTLLGLEDLLLKGKSEKEKAAFRMAVNLANAEKRENAKKIISDSYTAAMGAQKALSSIPYVGPFLGAAAAAAILAAGVSYAAQSLSGRALGGQVRAGESYLVGERGPEVLTMGNMAGNVTPNSALGGGGQTVNKTANVSFSIQANDTEGFDDLLNSRRGVLVSIINEALNDNGRAALV